VSFLLLWNLLIFAGYHRRVARFSRDAAMEAALADARSELARVARVMIMGELTASIAHEVNQPLGAIVVNAGACRRWLSQQPPAIGEAQQAADRIVRDADRAAEVIARIRTFVRKEKPRTAPVDINDTICEVLALARAEIERHRVSVETELAPLAPVAGDKVAFQQVLLNLVMNAVEAMAPVEDRARELKIRSRRDEAGRVHVGVHDTGTGLGADDAERIFGPFFTTKPDGMGMGLWISRSIIEAHGGRMWASAASPCGSAFQFTLPAAEG
jgi:C4-dicarboxylate-specific signal transduction histidine kinase